MVAGSDAVREEDFSGNDALVLALEPLTMHETTLEIVLDYLEDLHPLTKEEEKKQLKPSTY